MAKEKDYYATLGVPRDASDEVIKKAYRNLAKKYHPDLHPDDKAAESRFKDMNEAYAVLSNPQKRREYDTGQRVIFEGPPGGPSPEAGGFNFSDFEFNIGGMEDLFGEFFGKGRRRIPKKGGDVEYQLGVDFLHAVKGTEVELTMRRDGTEKIKVRIPPGLKDGARVRVAGKGSRGEEGGPPGDLYIIARVKPHPYFKRVDNDIYLDCPVTVQEAVFGATVEVPTMGGFTKIKIPPGVTSGQKLRIKGRGVSSPVEGAGDQYVVIKIAMPEKVDGKTRELLEELQKINPYEPRKDLW
ncbi:MAG: DnaJ domain-containing protein [Deltaproteobacteria bacterium]|nr:DnaJ domain-containing protein [Deltaproteobacteria bacterium]